MDRDPDQVEALVARAEAYLSKEDYQEAMSDYERAYQKNRQDQRIMQGYQKAQRLLKKAGMRDYYKILGVTRSATTREIKKAYRKLAQQWHPDKYKGELSAEKVQQKMSEINTAYEVLGNDELRARYDEGDDPNDPQGSQQQQHGGFPGGFGGFPGGFPGGFGGFPGGGGQQFHFRFT